MDWKTLFLSANGRIGRRDFWIGFVILFVGGFILGMIPLLGFLISLALIYPNVCVSSKRLHDMGRSGWLSAVPYGVMAVAMVVSFVTGGAAMFSARMANEGSGAGGAAALAGMGMAVAAICIGLVVCLAFLIWIGVSKSEPGENQYGPPAVSLTGGSTPAGTVAS